MAKTNKEILEAAFRRMRKAQKKVEEANLAGDMTAELLEEQAMTEEYYYGLRDAQ